MATTFLLFQNFEDYDLTSFLLGFGCFLSYFGILQYLTFFSSYNVSVSIQQVLTSSENTTAQVSWNISLYSKCQISINLEFMSQKFTENGWFCHYWRKWWAEPRRRTLTGLAHASPRPVCVAPLAAVCFIFPTLEAYVFPWYLKTFILLFYATTLFIRNWFRIHFKQRRHCNTTTYF